MKNINGEDFKIILAEYQTESEIYDYCVDSSSFKGSSMKEKNFRLCIFNNCKFTRCNMSNSQFTACIFNGCEFEGCYTQSTAFVRCTYLFTVFAKGLMAKSEFTQNNLANCEFISCQLIDAKFFNCHFVGHFRFINVNLTNAVFDFCTRFKDEKGDSELFGANVNFKNMRILNCNFNLHVEIDDRIIELIKRLKGDEGDAAQRK